MDHKKVSIIIPVYNNEKFLDKCLTSVINQTLNDIEIIIINDGSTDGSLMKLKDYECVNSNIILLNQSNGGQAVAINRALDIACGEYIAFVDADDYMEHNMIETLYKEAKSSNLDLVICNWSRVDTNGKMLSYNDHSNFDNKLLDRNEVIQEFLLNKKELVEGFSWNKLIKRNLFNEFKIRYPKTKYGDIPAIFRALTKVKKCKYVNKTLYHYVQHNAQITHMKNEEKVKSFIEAIQMINGVLMEENLISEFKDDYFIYKSNRFLSEYSASSEVVNCSKELTRTFKTILQPITIKKCITFNKSIDFKLLIKICLYKMRLLRIFIVAYHKFKPIF